MDALIIEVCEECLKIFTPEELSDGGQWGHPCKRKSTNKDIRCESYLQEYAIKHSEQQTTHKPAPKLKGVINARI